MSTHEIVIDDPIINSLFEEPKRHYRFGETGITNEIDEGPKLARRRQTGQTNGGTIGQDPK